MFIPLALAASTAVMVTTLMTTSYFEREAPHEVRYAASEAGLYRGFALAAQSYMASHPGFTGTLTWDQLKLAETTPPGMRNINLNPSWKVVSNSGEWVLCARLSERAVAALGQLMPQDSKPVRVVHSVVDYVWMGHPTETSKVMQCS